MKKSTIAIIDELINRYSCLAGIKQSILDAVDAIIVCYLDGKKIMVCGNGGSASDSLHIVGELMKGFALPRKLPDKMRAEIAKHSDNAAYINANLQGALSAISLVNEIALQTAYANDVAPDLDFAQQVYGYGNRGDILIGISTSGNSKNIIYAAEVAKAKGVIVVGLTGCSGGRLKNRCDYLINVPETETYKIQELHLPVYHAICLALENEFFG